MWIILKNREKLDYFDQGSTFIIFFFIGFQLAIASSTSDALSVLRNLPLLSAMSQPICCGTG